MGMGLAKLTAFSEAYLPFPRVGIDPSLVLFQPCSDISYQMNYFSWESPGIGRYLTSLTIQGFSFLFLLFLIETNLLWRLRTLVCGICRRRKWVSRSTWGGEARCPWDKAGVPAGWRQACVPRSDPTQMLGVRGVTRGG